MGNAGTLPESIFFYLLAFAAPFAMAALAMDYVVALMFTSTLPCVYVRDDYVPVIGARR